MISPAKPFRLGGVSVYRRVHIAQRLRRGSTEAFRRQAGPVDDSYRLSLIVSRRLRVPNRVRSDGRPKAGHVEVKIPPKKRGDGKTVLVVDDSAYIRKAVEQVFLSDGFKTCVEAENGQDAINVAKKCQPDVIILDLSMPVMNGLEAAPILRRMFPKTTIFLFSLFADAVNEDTAAKAGVDLVLSKNEPLSSVLGKAHEMMGR
jgi:CheY-like chemotaxis protein